MQSVPAKENICFFLTENNIFPRLAVFRCTSFEHPSSNYQTSRTASNCIAYCGLLFYALLVVKCNIAVLSCVLNHVWFQLLKSAWNL
jgi:hypothetical protein